MATEPVTQRMIEDLRRTLDRMSADLDRVEVLTAALHGFAQPIPDYEPTFRHFSHAQLTRHELGGAD